MPLFGNKKKDQQPKQGGYPVQGGYPQQQYPTHQVTPQQHQQNPTYPHQAYPLSGGYGPPPLGAYPQGAPPPYPYTPLAHQVPPAPPQTTVIQAGGFDAGARFHGGNSSIPPPPPGCMPNAAQMAMTQGQNVVVTQRPQDFISGGSDGGYVVW